MGKITLNSILLFVLVIPFIMGYRIGPDETPYYLFGIIFLELLLYLVLDLLHLPEKKYFLLKRLLLFLIIMSVIGSAFSAAISVRHKTAPIYMIHDIILQQEAAIRFLLDGKNPYKETYFGTPLEEWHYSETEVNPALYHFVMQPAYLVIPLPFYFASNILLGYFDARVPLLFLFFIMLFVAALAVKEKEKQLEFVILLAFNPAMLAYTLEGRSDVFMYAFMLILNKISLYTLWYCVGYSLCSKAICVATTSTLCCLFAL
jgi:hypothetical protein